MRRLVISESQSDSSVTLGHLTDDGFVYAAAPPSPPRRDLLICEDSAAASKVLPLSEPLSTVGHPEVNPYTDTTIPASYARQMMSRMSWGFSAGTWGQLRRQEW